MQPISRKEGNHMKAKVYFSRNLTPETVVSLCRMAGKELPGKVAVKLHSGEVGRPELFKTGFLETGGGNGKWNSRGMQYGLCW